MSEKAGPPRINTQTVGPRPSGKSPPGCEGGGKGGKAETSKKGLWFDRKRVAAVGSQPSLVRGVAPWSSSTFCPNRTFSPSLLAFSELHHKREWRGARQGRGWAITRAVRGNGSQLLCGRGGPGLPGGLCFSEPKKTLQELPWGANSKDGEPTSLGCTLPNRLPWLETIQFVSHHPSPSFSTVAP